MEMIEAEEAAFFEAEMRSEGVEKGYGGVDDDDTLQVRWAEEAINIVTEHLTDAQKL